MKNLSDYPDGIYKGIYSSLSHLLFLKEKEEILGINFGNQHIADEISNILKSIPVDFENFRIYLTKASQLKFDALKASLQYRDSEKTSREILEMALNNSDIILIQEMNNPKTIKLQEYSFLTGLE